MTPATVFAGRDVALFGLGGSGLATAKALKFGGANVFAWDDSPERVAAAASEGVGTEDLREADFSRFAALILSPGVPLTHPEPHWSATKARDAGVEIIGDIELFCRERAKIAPDAPFIAVTGTNGKSTTTALLAHILREAGRDVQLGGNIGPAILSLEPPSPDRVHVVEVSTFQIDLAPSIDPSIGLLLNLSPDHLDRHGTMENYAAIKERLVARSKLALIGVDDAWCDDIGRRLSQVEGSDVYPVSGAKVLLWGYFTHDGLVIARNAGEALDEALALCDIEGVETLRGRHNAQNAAFACAAAWHAGVAPQAIAAALPSFPGLVHRMELVGRVGKTLFVNDSKATNADSTLFALESYPRVHWILGGKPKAGGIASLEPLFGRVAMAYLIGAATDEFAATLEGKVAYERCGTLDLAVAHAAEDAARSEEEAPVVLFSPACASYDQFRSFEHRGDVFRELVGKLPGGE
ncbi:MAG: UDP-N-acetylmuramoyl-L-alanine--D-glutamate ligase [Salinarimonadaceae bacterium]|nr:MAG: UDP-N-acetylmuramoyl-L-alanine--D-glutamate ligase [Salinarimonadaceae bacterium]